MSKDFPPYANQFSNQVISNIESDPVDYSMLNPGTSTNPTPYRQQFLQLPPQLKGLILYKNNINIPTSVAGQTIFNPTIFNTMNSEGDQDEEYYALYDFRFTKLYEIEYFAGFGTTTVSRGLGISPTITSQFKYNLSDNWKQLTKSVIFQARLAGKTLFCRFKEYNNSELKVSNQVDESMPLVQRYFYFTPTGATLEEPINAAQTRWLDSLPDPAFPTGQQQAQADRERRQARSERSRQELARQREEEDRRLEQLIADETPETSE
jgi:hypothetical protein